MARSFEAAAAGVRVAPIMGANQSAVSLGWFWAMARSYPMTRSAATSCSPSSWRDLDTRRSHWSRVIWTSRPIAIGVASGICAERSSCRVRFTSCVHLLRTVRELSGHGRINGRACSFVCGCGTHVYSTCTGPGHGLRTPYWTRCTARVNTGACLLHFACVRAVRGSAWIVRAVMYVECVCVCVR